MQRIFAVIVLFSVLSAAQVYQSINGKTEVKRGEQVSEIGILTEVLFSNYAAATYFSRYNFDSRQRECVWSLTAEKKGKCRILVGSYRGKFGGGLLLGAYGSSPFYTASFRTHQNPFSAVKSNASDAFFGAAISASAWADENVDIRLHLFASEQTKRISLEEESEGMAEINFNSSGGVERWDDATTARARVCGASCSALVREIFIAQISAVGAAMVDGHNDIVSSEHGNALYRGFSSCLRVGGRNGELFGEWGAEYNKEKGRYDRSWICGARAAGNWGMLSVLKRSLPSNSSMPFGSSVCGQRTGSVSAMMADFAVHPHITLKSAVRQEHYFDVTSREHYRATEEVGLNIRASRRVFLEQQCRRQSGAEGFAEHYYSSQLTVYGYAGELNGEGVVGSQYRKYAAGVIIRLRQVNFKLQYVKIGGNNSYYAGNDNLCATVKINRERISGMCAYRASLLSDGSYCQRIDFGCSAVY